MFHNIVVGYLWEHSYKKTSTSVGKKNHRFTPQVENTLFYAERSRGMRGPRVRSRRLKDMQIRKHSWRTSKLPTRS